MEGTEDPFFSTTEDANLTPEASLVFHATSWPTLFVIPRESDSFIPSLLAV